MIINTLIKHSTTLTIVLNMTNVHKRFMLSRTALKSLALNNKLASHDAEQIARSALRFSKMITDPEMVANLGASSTVVTANTHVTIKVHDYIIDSNMIGGTSTIKTNFMAVFINQNKQMVYPYSHLVPLVNNTKLSFHPSVYTLKGAPDVVFMLSLYYHIYNVIVDLQDPEKVFSIVKSICKFIYKL